MGYAIYNAGSITAGAIASGKFQMQGAEAQANAIVNSANMKNQAILGAVDTGLEALDTGFEIASLRNGMSGEDVKATGGGIQAFVQSKQSFQLSDSASAFASDQGIIGKGVDVVDYRTNKQIETSMVDVKTLQVAQAATTLANTKKRSDDAVRGASVYQLKDMAKAIQITNPDRTTGVSDTYTMATEIAEVSRELTSAHATHSRISTDATIKAVMKAQEKMQFLEGYYGSENMLGVERAQNALIRTGASDESVNTLDLSNHLKVAKFMEIIDKDGISLGSTTSVNYFTKAGVPPKVAIALNKRAVDPANITAEETNITNAYDSALVDVIKNYPGVQRKQQVMMAATQLRLTIDTLDETCNEIELKLTSEAGSN
jgi:hypothetical protein